MKQPVKTGDKIDTILSAALDTVERVKQFADPVAGADGVMLYFVGALASTLLTSEQQQQADAFLKAWQDCRSCDCPRRADT